MCYNEVDKAASFLRAPNECPGVPLPLWQEGRRVGKVLRSPGCGAGKVEYMVTRVFVEKKQGFNIEAQHMLADLKGNLGVQGLEEVRILNRYDVSGLSREQFAAAARTILSEPTMDAVYGGGVPASGGIQGVRHGVPSRPV